MDTMKNRLDRLAESYFTPEKEELELDSLYEIIEEHLQSALNEADPSRSKIKFSFDQIPDIPISELGFADVRTLSGGGKRSAPQRMALKRWTDRIRGTTLPKTLDSLAEFYEGGFKFRADATTGGRIQTILTYLIFYKTLTQIIQGFNAASAGFTFESFLAATIGGQQIATGNKTIADLTDAKGTMISLKLYKEASTKVDGSWQDLVNDLVGPDGPGYMHYIVVTKDLQGEGLEQQGSLKWYRFNFNPSNVVNILSKTHRHRILQLPKQFIADPEGGDVNATLPEPTNISVEELEAMFEDYINKSELAKDHPDGMKELLQRTDWAAGGPDGNLFVSPRRPGRDKMKGASVKGIINDLINRGHFQEEQYAEINNVLVQANQNVINYRSNAGANRAAALEELSFATTEESVAFYNNTTDPEIKRRALYNTRGYLFVDQFHMSRSDVINVASHAGDQAGDIFPDGQTDVFLQEIKIGGKYVVEMLERAKAEIDNSVFEIFNNVKLLKVSLDQYFAGALNDDTKAKDAIGASKEIEGKTEELRQI
jgi:hypothetical protein